MRNSALFMNGKEAVGLSRKTEVFFICGKRSLHIFHPCKHSPLKFFLKGLGRATSLLWTILACVVCSWPWASVSSPTEWEYYFCRGIMKIRTRCAGAGECLVTASWREPPAVRKCDTRTLFSVLNGEGTHQKEF